MIQPALFVPHGGGPAFFMTGPMHEMFEPMAKYLRHSLDSLAERPRAIIVITAHWEASPIAINAMDNPSLLYDYYGFPPETYEIDYRASGSPELAQKISDLFTLAAINHRLDKERGWDHGVFIPLKIMVPQAEIPIVSISLHPQLDPVLHHRVGEAISQLREDGVLVVGSGMSFHNLRQFTSSKKSSMEFDNWLDQALTQPKSERAAALAQWQSAPLALEAHPRSEHLIPLMVCSGSGSDLPAIRDWSGTVGETLISAWRFN